MLVPTAIESIAAFIPGLLGAQKVNFISVPVRTGKRFADKRAHELNSSCQLKSSISVINMNRTSAETFVDSIRESLDGPHISTAHFSLPGWSKVDYRILWEYVVRHYASAVYMHPEWYYAAECAIVYCTAMREGIPVYGSDMKQITNDDAIALLHEGMSYLSACYTDDSDLRAAIADIFQYHTD